MSNTLFQNTAVRLANRNERILILSSDTGGGHRSAANALCHSLEVASQYQAQVRISKLLEESHVVPKAMAELYNIILQRKQHWMKYYYWAIEQFRPNELPLMFKLAEKYASSLIDQYQPTAIVSVHPMMQHFVAYILQRKGLLGQIPFHTVVTDPLDNFWHGWACPIVDTYYVATPNAKNQLVHYGIDAGQIKVVGMPVHRSFKPANPNTRHQLREALGLEPNHFTVFLNAGFMGGGNLPRIFEALCQQSEQVSQLPLQVVYLSGSKPGLFEQAQAIARQATFSVTVLDKTETMADWMNASDVIATKMGGLTTFEALTCGIPMIIDATTPPMPQEAATADFVAHIGAGVPLTRADQIGQLINQLMQSPSQLHQMRACAKQYAQAGACDRIAQDLLTLAPQVTQYLPVVKAV